MMDRMIGPVCHREEHICTMKSKTKEQIQVELFSFLPQHYLFQAMVVQVRQNLRQILNGCFNREKLDRFLRDLYLQLLSKPNLNLKRQKLVKSFDKFFASYYKVTKEDQTEILRSKIEIMSIEHQNMSRRQNEIQQHIRMLENFIRNQHETVQNLQMLNRQLINKYEFSIQRAIQLRQNCKCMQLQYELADIKQKLRTQTQIKEKLQSKLQQEANENRKIRQKQEKLVQEIREYQEKNYQKQVQVERLKEKLNESQNNLNILEDQARKFDKKRRQLKQMIQKIQMEKIQRQAEHLNEMKRLRQQNRLKKI